VRVEPEISVKVTEDTMVEVVVKLPETGPIVNVTVGVGKFEPISDM